MTILKARVLRKFRNAFLTENLVDKNRLAAPIYRYVHSKFLFYFSKDAILYAAGKIIALSLRSL
jgi:hypothetical protein